MIKQRLLLSTFLMALVVAPANAQIFGPSDEEKAREDAQDSGIHDLQNSLQQDEARIKVLEDKVRSLTDSLSQTTGANEELGHQIQLLNDKIDRMQKDFAYRFCTLSAQQVGAGDAMNCAAAGTPSAGAVSPQSYSQSPGAALPPITGGVIDATGNGGFAAPPNDNGAPVMGRPPGTLGTLPMNSGPMNSPPAISQSAPTNSTQYNQAMNLMSRAQYSEAAAAFRAYADTYPDDVDLAPQSIYWVANISFIRQDYAGAARTFAELIKKYPKSQRAPDAMLKLAQSFMAMDQKQKAAQRLALSGRNIPTPVRKRSRKPQAYARPPAANKLETDFAAAMAGYEAPFAVAVSGGSDSMALMHLVKNYARKKRLPAPAVLTVDHGLRNASTSEARQVVGWAKKANLKAHMLTRRGPVARSDIEAWARDARYRLMGNWLIKHQISTLLVGHTLDDQAETFLLRLARGSGLDGLSAMRSFAPWPVLGFAQLRVGRPLLSISREALRNYLKASGHDWLDDPMNEDNAFDRVRIRKMVPALASAGLSIERIAAAASHLARARETLEIVTQAVLARAVRKSPEGIFLDAAALAGAPREVGLRALASVLMAVSGQPYRPRFESLERLFNALAEGKLGGGATLHGCHIRPSRKDFASFSLLVRPESPRKTGSSANKGA